MMKNFKFEPGNTVYLVSDLKKRIPMTIVRVLEFDPDDNDYTVTWITSQKKFESMAFPEKVLTT